MAKAVKPTQIPRGIRNNNPGNLRRSKDPWQGLAAEQTDRAFFQFETPVDGIRALAKTLLVYHDKRRARDGTAIDTVAEVIERWAPPSENNTRAYIAQVNRLTGWPPDQVLDLHRYDHMRPLVEAIITVENGQQPYTDAQIDAALARIAILPERPRSLQASRTVKGAQVAAGGGTVAAASGTIAALGPAVPVLKEIAAFVRDNPVELLIGLGLLAIVGAGIAVYAKWDERRRGIA